MKKHLIRFGPLLILLLGIGSGVGIYLTAGPDDPPAYDPMESKGYLRQMEAIGGKANLLAAECIQWFDALWHGRNLAYTIAAMSVFLALGFRFFATRLYDND